MTSNTKSNMSGDNKFLWSQLSASKPPKYYMTKSIQSKNKTSKGSPVFNQRHLKFLD